MQNYDEVSMMNNKFIEKIYLRIFFFFAWRKQNHLLSILLYINTNFIAVEISL